MAALGQNFVLRIKHNLIKNILNILSYQTKKRKYMKFYNFLLSFHILKSLEDSLLSIFNVSKCDHFILLSLYNIFNFYEVVIIYLSFFFIKNILN